ncbi:unnamed protein product [Cladocopium goreaui]|uniref:Choline transporter-like protein n=1 Tax=Cladocopium goreaui TaxID=2562237 RepID=A0A9P1G6A5_9DINO|nr:unnamed protein product [Cladocopium goreaui]
MRELLREEEQKEQRLPLKAAEPTPRKLAVFSVLSLATALLESLGLSPHGKSCQSQRRLEASEEPDPNLTPDEQKAHIRKRTCTDVFCVLLFAGAIVGLFEVLRYGFQNGDTRRIYYGLNWEGELCGLDEPVKDKPLLYWCTKPGDSTLSEDLLNNFSLPTELKDPSGAIVSLINKIVTPGEALDLLHPICVASCPVDSGSFHPCLQSVNTEKGTKSFDGSFLQTSDFISKLVQDVETITFAHRFCMPKESFAWTIETLNETVEGTATEVMYGLAEIVEARKIFLFTGCMAVVLSYLFMFTLDCLAFPVVYTTLTICVVGPIGASLYFIYGAFHQEISTALIEDAGWNVVLPEAITTSDRNWDIICSILCLILGIGVACFWCCKSKSINFVIVAVKATIRVLYDVPTLILLPSLNTAARAIVLILAMWGLALVVSVGEVAAYDIHSWVPQGLARTFEHTQDERLYILYYIFACAWIYELLLALQQFVVAYTVLIWYNAPLNNGKKKVPCAPIVRAAFMGLTYHLGSLAFGAVLLAFFRIIYILVTFFYNQNKKNEDEQTNGVVKAATACCCCCLNCFEQVLRYLNSGAYVMVAVNSDNYCQGADRAVKLMLTEFVAIGALEGSTFLFQTLGNISIPAAGGYLTYLMVTQLEQFNSVASVDYIAQPKVIAVAGGLVCLGVSMSFMSIFDTVSDAMLFAFMTDEDWRKQHGLPPNPNIPENLMGLIKAGES